MSPMCPKLSANRPDSNAKIWCPHHQAMMHHQPVDCLLNPVNSQKGKGGKGKGRGSGKGKSNSYPAEYYPRYKGKGKGGGKGNGRGFAAQGSDFFEWPDIDHGYSDSSYNDLYDYTTWSSWDF